MRPPAVLGPQAASVPSSPLPSRPCREEGKKWTSGDRWRKVQKKEGRGRRAAPTDSSGGRSCACRHMGAGGRESSGVSSSLEGGCYEGRPRPQHRPQQHREALVCSLRDGEVQNELRRGGGGKGGGQGETTILSCQRRADFFKELRPSDLPASAPAPPFTPTHTAYKIETKKRAPARLLRKGGEGEARDGGRSGRAVHVAEDAQDLIFVVLRGSYFAGSRERAGRGERKQAEEAGGAGREKKEGRGESGREGGRGRGDAAQGGVATAEASRKSGNQGAEPKHTKAGQEERAFIPPASDPSIHIQADRPAGTAAK